MCGAASGMGVRATTATGKGLMRAHVAPTIALLS